MNKISQDKFFDGNGGEYLSLVEISEVTPYSVDYLVSVAKLGKLKSFRIHDEWYSSHDWLEDFNTMIRSRLEQELPENTKGSWTSYLSKPQRRIRWFNYFLVVILSAIIYVWVIIFSLLVLYLISVDGYYRFGNRFLEVTNQIYSWPTRTITTQGEPIYDEALTEKWQEIMGIKSNSGWVAGQSDNL